MRVKVDSTTELYHPPKWIGGNYNIVILLLALRVPLALASACAFVSVLRRPHTVVVACWYVDIYPKGFRGGGV